jgi:glucokinase
MKSFAIGVDLGGTNMRIAAVEPAGRQLAAIRAATDLKRGRDEILSQICSGVHELARRFAPDLRLIGIGVGVPGIIDLQSGTVHSAANLPGWENYPVRQELEKRLCVPVVLENDANCAAMGEQWLGAGQGVDDLCMITLGTGVGGGFVVQGKPWHGLMGMAGELGHMTVVPEGTPCGCGSRGCLEQYASATAITRMAVEAVARNEAPALAREAGLNPNFDARSVYDCYQHGDAAAKAIFESAGSALGIALANLINALNLPLHVIGGGVARAWEAFSPAMFRELNRRSIVFRAGEFRKSRYKATMVVPSNLHGNAGVLGAARLPMLLERPSSRRFQVV